MNSNDIKEKNLRFIFGIIGTAAFVYTVYNSFYYDDEVIYVSLADSNKKDSDQTEEFAVVKDDRGIYNIFLNESYARYNGQFSVNGNHIILYTVDRFSSKRSISHVIIHSGVLRIYDY